MKWNMAVFIALGSVAGIYSVKYYFGNITLGSFFFILLVSILAGLLMLFISNIGKK